MNEITDQDAIEVKASILRLQQFEQKHSAPRLLNKHGVLVFLKKIEAVTKREQQQQYLQSLINKEMQPMQQQLDAILAALQQKPIKSGAKDLKFAPTTDVELEVDKKLEKTSKQWEKVSDSAELTVYKWGEHLLTIYSDSDGNKMANVDNGKNIAIKSDNELTALKKKVEGMT